MASTLIVDNIVGATTAANVKMPAGHIIQVVDTTSTAIAYYSNAATSAWQDLMTLNITPKYNTSKILLTASITCGTENWGVLFRVLQGGSVVTGQIGADDGGGRSVHTFSTVPYAANDDETATASYTGIFSPATASAVTYKIQGAARTGTTWSFNRSEDSPSSNQSRSKGVSSLVLMEIAQ